MIRFVDGVPKYVWFSQHANGEAYTFEALAKDESGNRVSSPFSFPLPYENFYALPRVTQESMSD
jgi:hypothetical protein